jgi:hypothetical protein
LSRVVVELFGLRLQCRRMGEKGKGVGVGLGTLRKRREGVQLGGGGCQVEEQGGRGPGGRQQPGATEAGAGRVTHEKGRRRGWSGQVGPDWKRERGEARGPRLEHMGRARRRKTGQARRNSVIFY